MMQHIQAVPPQGHVLQKRRKAILKTEVRQIEEPWAHIEGVAVVALQHLTGGS